MKRIFFKNRCDNYLRLTNESLGRIKCRLDYLQDLFTSCFLLIFLCYTYSTFFISIFNFSSFFNFFVIRKTINNNFQQCGENISFFYFNPKKLTHHLKSSYIVI